MTDDQKERDGVIAQLILEYWAGDDELDDVCRKVWNASRKQIADELDATGWIWSAEMRDYIKQLREGTK